MDVRYTGKIAKRPAQTEQDIISLSPGAELSTAVDMSDCFEFEEGHSYRFHLNMTGQRLVSNHHTIVSTTKSIAPKDKRNHAGRGGERHLLATTYSGCTADQQAVTETALANVIEGLVTAYDDNLLQGCANDDYEEFFGPYSTGRYANVLENYRRMQAEFLAENFIIDCSDSEATYFAYVYPNDQTHRIYVCAAYWSASAEISQDSKPGTLVHEMSHFNDVAATDDHQYGISGCRSLAQSNPRLAITNADSHEYYFEMIPSFGTDCCSFDTSSCGGFCTTCNDLCQELSQCGVTTSSSSSSPSTPTTTCSEHADCSGDTYCDAESVCWDGCCSCSYWNDPIDGTCPPCAEDCGVYEYWYESGECQAHSDCSGDTYCDRYENCWEPCWSCYFVWDDAIDGICPYCLDVYDAEFFAQFDADGDSSLSFDEYMAMLRNGANLPAQHVSDDIALAVFTAIDANVDNEITEIEFQLWIESFSDEIDVLIEAQAEATTTDFPGSEIIQSGDLFNEASHTFFASGIVLLTALI
jgi:peptidyl-Lys metalloendopeptidase